MVNFVIRLKRGDPRVLLELFLFNFVAILNWILSNQLYFHLVVVIMHQLVYGYLPVKITKFYFITEAPSNRLLNLPFNFPVHQCVMKIQSKSSHEMFVCAVFCLVLFHMSSVDSQKGVITIQRCSVENQKGAIAVQSLWR